jgi:sugar-specific transcriptional regulator TrmB
MKPEHEALRALGLTEYAARAYAALVSLGASEASVVASAGPIPRTKVYAVLKDLVKRGWVQVEAGRPQRFRAMRPRDCFERERERLDALVDAALPILEEQYEDRSTRFGGPLWILDGAQPVVERALRMVAEAKEDVLLVASFQLPGDGRELARALREAQRRGVRVRVTVTDPEAMPELARSVPEVRVLRVPPRFLAVDGRQALVVVPSPRADGAMDVRGVWNPSAELLSVMGLAMGGLWEMATPPGESGGVSGPPPERPARPRRGTPRRS